LEAVRVFAGAADPADPGRRIFVATDVDHKAVLLKKPEPGFTDWARANNTSGVVKLRLILSADGRVKHILVVKGLPDGLTERAVAAARGIKFIPAVKDGKPVSVVVTVEYNFNIY
jgi:TonB family protein